MASKSNDTKGLQVSSSDDSSPDVQNSKYSNLDSEQLKLINELSPMRESIVKSVLSRFPMKGLDTIIKQAFDEAVVKNLRDAKKLFSKTLLEKPQNPKPEGSQDKQLKQDKAEDTVNKIQNEEHVKKPVGSQPAKRSEESGVSLVDSTKDKSSDSMVEDYKKRIEQLILEIKIRDKKLKQNEEIIRTLKQQLELLEQQNMPPFLESWRLEEESREEDINQLKSQIRRWEILWQKMKTFFEGDPRFKTLFILQRLGSISIKNLSQALNLESGQIEPIIRELQESHCIILDGDIVRMNTN
ncbi:MAG: hypothetical protein QXO71_03735 [Candidatus Jordarchaeaceae archaeon]